MKPLRSEKMSLDLKQVLEAFDSQMRTALHDSEMVLRLHGASEEEVESWRQTFVPEWEETLRVQRDALIQWCLQELRILH